MTDTIVHNHILVLCFRDRKQIIYATHLTRWSALLMTKEPGGMGLAVEGWGVQLGINHIRMCVFFFHHVFRKKQVVCRTYGRCNTKKEQLSLRAVIILTDKY